MGGGDGVRKQCKASDKPSCDAGCCSDGRRRLQAAGTVVERAGGCAHGAGTPQPGPASAPSQTAPVCCRSVPWGQRKQSGCSLGRWCQGPPWWQAVSSGHSQVVLGVVLTSHQECQRVIDLEADNGVSDAWLWGWQVPKVCGIEARRPRRRHMSFLWPP